MLRIHIDHCLHGRIHNLQIGTTRWRQSQSQLRSAYEKIGEMVMATVRIEENVQTMCIQATAGAVAVKWIVR